MLPITLAAERARRRLREAGAVLERRTWKSVVLILVGGAFGWNACLAQTQDPPRPAEAAPEEPAAQPSAFQLPMPAPIQPAVLGPTLKPVSEATKGQSPGQGKGFNRQSIDSQPLPRDKQGIWVLDMTFKPLRLVTVEVPGKGRRQVHYLWYRVVNRTGKARFFVPQFTLVCPETGKTYQDSVLPQAVKVIQAREDPTKPLLGSVEIAGYLPPSTKDGVDEAVYGVAIWEGVDPAADRLEVYVRGLSDGYQTIPAEGGKPARTKYKALKIDFTRPGDDRRINEREIRFLDPNRPFEWTYF